MGIYGPTPSRNSCEVRRGMDIFRSKSAGVCAVLMLSCLASAFASCGGEDDAADELSRQQELREERRQGAQEERLRQLERQLREEKRKSEKKNGGASKPESPDSTQPTSPPSSTSSCGDGLSVGPNTSCAFASSVREAYFDNGGGSGTVQAFSPVTGETYTMSCTAGAPTTCTGGNNASVFIR